jgi:hypothetical protein
MGGAQKAGVYSPLSIVGKLNVENTECNHLQRKHITPLHSATYFSFLVLSNRFLNTYSGSLMSGNHSK